MASTDTFDFASQAAPNRSSRRSFSHSRRLSGSLGGFGRSGAPVGRGVTPGKGRGEPPAPLAGGVSASPAAGAGGGCGLGGVGAGAPAAGGAGPTRAGSAASVGCEAAAAATASRSRRVVGADEEGRRGGRNG